MAEILPQTLRRYRRERPNGGLFGLCWRYWRGLCAYCGRRCNYVGGMVDSGTIDRIVPGHLGGDYRLGNVVLACQACNSSKFNRRLAEWFSGKVHPPERVPAPWKQKEHHATVILHEQDVAALDRWIESAEKDGLNLSRSSIIRSLIRERRGGELEREAEDEAHRRDVAGL